MTYPWCLSAVLLMVLGCKMENTDFKRTPSLPAVVLEGPTPPPAASAEGEKLYQLLYAGESGPRASALGQHARLVAWLAAMDFSATQLDQLVALLDRLDDARALQAQHLRERDEQEVALLGPIYRRIGAAYLNGQHPDEATLAGFAAELEAARATLYAEQDPRAYELERVTRLMSWLDDWIQSLSEEQRHDLGQCRFFLRRRLGPLLNPGDYGSLTGISWDGGDFRGVNTTFPDDDEHHMDIGGLWSTEFMRAPPMLYLEELQLKALLLMALEEPGLRLAIVARRGGSVEPGAEADQAEGVEAAQDAVEGAASPALEAPAVGEP